MRRIHSCIVGLTTLALAGCAGAALQNAETLTPGGSQFDKWLYAGYIDLAKLEYGEGDYDDSDKFALRAASAAGGKAPSPERIAARDLPRGKKGELSDARARLVAALDAGARSKAPMPAATAQVMFDCWIQEQEENFQPPHIARCRGGFLDAMARIDAVVAGRPIPGEASIPPTPGKMNRRFVVYFPYDSSEITDDSKRVILRAIDVAKEIGARRIFVTGHTDRAGSGAYNDRLSDIRAYEVVNRLAEGGVSPRVISVSPLGESMPAVPTDDGVRQARNRRVEIDISN